MMIIKKNKNEKNLSIKSIFLQIVANLQKEVKHRKIIIILVILRENIKSNYYDDIQ
jgi:hypothetical protein